MADYPWSDCIGVRKRTAPARRGRRRIATQCLFGRADMDAAGMQAPDAKVEAIILDGLWKDCAGQRDYV